MRDYAKVAPTFWTGETGKAIRRKGPDAIVVALYLMTSPTSNMLGLYYQPILYMAHETGLGVERASEGVTACCDVEFCSYDRDTEFVWVKEMAAYQIADELKASDNRCLGIQREYDGLPDNPFLGAFFDRYALAFHMANRRGEEGAYQDPSKPGTGAGEGTGEPTASLRSGQSAAPQTDLLGGTGKVVDLDARTANRLAVVTAQAIEAYNRILAKPTGLLTAVHRTVGHSKRQTQVKRCLKTAAEICKDQFSDSKVIPDFWEMLFVACKDDPFLSGKGPYSGAHANWRPDFEYLTREATVLKAFERAASEAEAG